MEISIDTLQKAVELIKADNKEEFEKFFYSLSKGDQKDILDSCSIGYKNKNIDLRSYKIC
jgi:hypothetical protein